MPKFTITTPSKSSSQETYKKVKAFLETDEGLRKLDSGLSCTFDDQKLNCNAKGSQFKADMQIKAQGAESLVEVTVDLPFMLTPFKGKIQETLQRKLDKVLS